MGKKSSLFVVYNLLLWVLTGSPISWGQEDSSVQTKCSLTTYPNLCTKTLSGIGLQNVADDMLSALVERTRYETKLLAPNLSSLSTNQHSSLEHHNDSHVVLGYCSELMNMSLKRLDQSLQALKESPTKHKGDIQTWLSAVLTFQHTCKDSINGLSRISISEISSKVDYLSQLASNSLALVNAIPGTQRSRTTRRGLLSAEKLFPDWVSSKDRKLLQTVAVEANAVVAKDGSGNFETVSEAIKASPGGRFVIYVKSGTYKEKININKDGITLIGDGKDSTIIYDDNSVASGSSMPGSATIVITGDEFIARDIGFQNTAGPKGEQALALNIASDRSVLYRCSIVGYQDTLYALALRQFYRECDIYGTVDFIFGNALAVFQSCNIVLRRPLSGGFNVILAHGREDPGQNTGFSLQRCKIMADSDLSPVKHSVESYLGRPWKKYSRSVIMQSTIDDSIKPRGWIEWSGSFALQTLYFAEYQNSGPGAGTSGRVQWSGYHQIGSEEAMKFTVAEFIGGTSWLPSTGVSFVSGLD